MLPGTQYIRTLFPFTWLHLSALIMIDGQNFNDLPPKVPLEVAGGTSIYGVHFGLKYASVLTYRFLVYFSWTSDSYARSLCCEKPVNVF